MKLLLTTHQADQGPNSAPNEPPRNWKHIITWNGLLLALLLLVWLLALGLGALSIPPLTVLRIVIEGIIPVAQLDVLPQPTHIEKSVIWEMRLPRSVLAVVCGAGLAVCGLATQALLRNILADPYILGLSSGASTGAALVMVLGVGFGFSACGVESAADHFTGDIRWYGGEFLFRRVNQPAHYACEKPIGDQERDVLDVGFV